MCSYRPRLSTTPTCGHANELLELRVLELNVGKGRHIHRYGSMRMHVSLVSQALASYRVTCKRVHVTALRYGMCVLQLTE